MEISLDIGRNTLNDLDNISATAGKTRDIVALEMIDLGILVSKASSNNQEETLAPETLQMLRLLVENNQFVKEIINCVFDKTKISERVSDAKTLTTMVENVAASFVNGINL